MTSSGRYRRVGRARAHRLEQPVEWRTSAGDRLTSPAGDWWVVTPDGIGRGVAASEFDSLYSPVENDVYERRGSVSAVRIDDSRVVRTLEGDAVAGPGDWVITDDRGNSWPVTDEVFRRSYEPIAASADPAHDADPATDDSSI